MTVSFLNRLLQQLSRNFRCPRAIVLKILKINQENFSDEIYLKQMSEAVVRRCSIKKVFLEISQNFQESTYARDSFLIKLQA